jgi:hypothetical protein
VVPRRIYQDPSTDLEALKYGGYKAHQDQKCSSTLVFFKNFKSNSSSASPSLCIQAILLLSSSALGA